MLTLHVNNIHVHYLITVMLLMLLILGNMIITSITAYFQILKCRY